MGAVWNVGSSSCFAAAWPFARLGCDSREVKLLRVLTDRGSEYCGNPERHEYELYLAIEDIDHSRTKTKSPQTTDVIDKNFFWRPAVSLRCKSLDLIHRIMPDFAIHLMAASLASGTPCQ
jgi:hypothetical protein